MRWFFLSLLLSNVALLAWQVWVAEPVVSAPVLRGSGLPEHGLTLLRELPSEQRPNLREGGDVTASTASAATVEPPIEAAIPENEPSRVEVPETNGAGQIAAKSACYRSDEYDSEKELDSVGRALGEYGAMDLQRERFTGERHNYWVMLAPYPTREKADEAAKMLQARKVKDFFIVRSGEFENAVSLGVYSTRERAERRAGEIAALKLRLREPRIEVRTIEAERYRIHFALPQGIATEVLEKLASRLPGTTFTKIDCK